MKTIKMYSWVLKVIGAALLIGLALYFKFSDGERIVIAFVGSMLIIYSIIRLVPFIKTQRNDLIKTINIMEITVSVLIGIFMVIGAIVVETIEGSDFSEIFGYMFGAVLIGRGAIHFYGLSNGAEKGDNVSYFFHIGALVAGTIVIMTSDFDAGVLVNLILLFSVASGGYLSFDSYKGYKAYRYQKTLNIDITDIPVDTPNVIPEQEEPVQDQIIS
ncbi:MAG: hypothetical protein QM489_01765 [Candidatus Izemoplasma sp.]